MEKNWYLNNNRILFLYNSELMCQKNIFSLNIAYLL